VAAGPSDPSATTRTPPSYEVVVKPRLSRRRPPGGAYADSALEPHSVEALGAKLRLVDPAVLDVSRDELVIKPILEIIRLPNGRGLG
jgi:hypothetical protein